MYETARAAGAIGGKLTGAGGGGFLLLFAPPETHAKLKESLKKLIHVPFGFESTGSQVIYFDQEEDFSQAEKENEHRSNLVFHEMEDLISTRST